ncbi:hypothetical protein HK101_006404 [Irineochytrium annulatum]|nr:hypothetical protein HK101_006404 [Irineochytrium annulatum]
MLSAAVHAAAAVLGAAVPTDEPHGLPSPKTKNSKAKKKKRKSTGAVASTSAAASSNDDAGAMASSGVVAEAGGVSREDFWRQQHESLTLRLARQQETSKALVKLLKSQLEGKELKIVELEATVTNLRLELIGLRSQPASTATATQHAPCVENFTTSRQSPPPAASAGSSDDKIRSVVDSLERLGGNLRDLDDTFTRGPTTSDVIDGATTATTDEDPVDDEFVNRAARAALNQASDRLQAHRRNSLPPVEEEDEGSVDMELEDAEAEGEEGEVTLGRIDELEAGEVRAQRTDLERERALLETFCGVLGSAGSGEGDDEMVAPTLSREEQNRLLFALRERVRVQENDLRSTRAALDSLTARCETLQQARDAIDGELAEALLRLDSHRRGRAAAERRAAGLEAEVAGAREMLEGVKGAAAAAAESGARERELALGLAVCAGRESGREEGGRLIKEFEAKIARACKGGATASYRAMCGPLLLL